MMARAIRGIVLLCMLYAFAGIAGADELSPSSGPSAPPPCDPAPCDVTIKENYYASQLAYRGCISVHGELECAAEQMNVEVAKAEYFKRFGAMPDKHQKLSNKANAKDDNGHAVEKRTVEDANVLKGTSDTNDTKDLSPRSVSPTGKARIGGPPNVEN